jgi:phosphohistidine phosphatase
MTIVPIYLVHHADAVGPDLDPQRPLSGRGLQQAEELARLAAGHGVKPQLIWHSGKVRARQTAEILRRRCAQLAPMSAERGLQPTDPPEWMRDRLAGEVGAVMLVGHFPHLPRLLELMIAGPPGGPGAGFPPHGLVTLEPAGERWTEAFRIAPATP